MDKEKDRSLQTEQKYKIDLLENISIIQSLVCNHPTTVVHAGGICKKHKRTCQAVDQATEMGIFLGFLLMKNNKSVKTFTQIIIYNLHQ